MTKKLILTGLILGCTASLFAQDSPTPESSPDSALNTEFFIDTVFFDFDRYQLRESYRAEIDSIIQLVIQQPSYYIEVDGHTDNIGTDYYNQQLSEMRAQEVYQLLADQGVDTVRMRYKGFGTAKPAATNETFSGRQKNRRTEIAVIYSSEPILDVRPEDLMAEQTEDPEPEPELPPEPAIEETLEANDKPLTVYTNRLTTINGKEGGRVVIPPNAFETDEETITIEMIELFQRSDMLMLGMPTITRDGPLQTEGMVLLEARDSRGRLVKVKPDTPIRVEIPSEEELPEMQVYLGRGGNISSRRRRQAVVKDFNPVKNWTLSEIPVAYVDTGEIGPHYEFKVNDLETFNVARPVYKTLDTDPAAGGVDFWVKLKGKRFEKNTKVMVAGESFEMIIPLIKRSKRIYTANNVQQLDENTPLFLIAHQHDNRENPYIGYEAILISEDSEMPKKKGFFARLFSFLDSSEEPESDRPIIKKKIKLKKQSQRDFSQLLEEL